VLSLLNDTQACRQREHGYWQRWQRLDKNTGPVGLQGIPASENPIVMKGQNVKDFALRSKRPWPEIISDAQETTTTSNFLPPFAPICPGDAMLQHFRKVRKDLIKHFALTQQVREINPTGEPRRMNIERISTAV
jgi:hypothetical protein